MDSSGELQLITQQETSREQLNKLSLLLDRISGLPDFLPVRYTKLKSKRERNSYQRICR